MAVALDLDHTLVHTCPVEVDGCDGFGIVLDDGEDAFVHIRPHALDLIEVLLRSDLRLVIWTAGTEGYGRTVLDGLKKRLGGDADGIDLFHRGHTIPSTDGKRYLKDIAWMRTHLGVDTLVLVDDDPCHLTMSTNRGFVIPVAPFYTRNFRTDTVLRDLVNGLLRCSSPA